MTVFLDRPNVKEIYIFRAKNEFRREIAVIKKFLCQILIKRDQYGYLVYRA